MAILLACFGVLVVSSYRMETKKDTVKQEETKERQEKVSDIYTEDYQEAVEKRLEKAKEAADYTEDAMLIEPNPYGTNTLSLYVYFQTEKPAKVSYCVSVNDEEINDFEAEPLQMSEYMTEHEFQVIGLVPGRKNTVIFTICMEDGTEKTYAYDCKAEKLSGDGETRLSQALNGKMTQELSNGLYVVMGNDSDGLDCMYYYDNQGIVRGEVPLVGYRSHRILFRDGLMYYSISENQIAAVNSLGKVEKIYDTGKYELHHDYVFDDDGNILVLATDTEQDSVEDVIIRIHTDTGEISETADLGDLLGAYKERCERNSDDEMDWIHINTIQWMGNGSVLLSSRETSTILKVSYYYPLYNKLIFTFPCKIKEVSA